MVKIKFMITKKIIMFSMLIMAISMIDYCKIFSANIRAGTAKVDITRENPTVSVNDPIYAKAVIFDNRVLLSGQKYNWLSHRQSLQPKPGM